MLSLFSLVATVHVAAQPSTGKWHITTIDSVGNLPGWTGRCTSLAIDANGYPHISYYDYTTDALKYAYRDATGQWHTETVDSGDNVQGHISIALDANGYPHISYQDINLALKYAYQDAVGWHTTTIDIAASDNSIALDANGYPHISYHDNTNGDLKYAYQDAVGWHIATVDSGG